MIEFRLNQARISCAWVYVFETKAPAEPYSDLIDPENQLQYGLGPEIFIYADDNIHTLDLRVLTGLVVHLSGRNEQRTAQVLKRINEFKPAVVFAMLGNKLVNPDAQVAA